MEILDNRVSGRTYYLVKKNEITKQMELVEKQKRFIDRHLEFPDEEEKKKFINNLLYNQKLYLEGREFEAEKHYGWMRKNIKWRKRISKYHLFNEKTISYFKNKK